MTGARAEWHLADLGAVDDDPFANAVYSIGLNIDLDAPLHELQAALKRTLDREGRLWTGGLECELKNSGQDCRSCPMATLDPADVRSRLCRLGKDQFALVERCDALTRAERAAFEEFAALAGEWSAVGHLDDDVAEVLTAVGL